MTKKKIFTLIFTMFFAATTFSGCIGGFRLSNTLLNWNKKATGNKFVNWIVFLVLWIIPVYGITIFVDILVLNSIEFWTGSNPMAMAPGEKETQYVKRDGSTYKIEATQNRFHIVRVDGPDSGAQADLIYNPNTNIWSVSNGSETAAVASFMDNGEVTVFTKQGPVLVTPQPEPSM
jgi:hypothetical protein